MGPFFHREKFGFSFWDSNPSNNNNNATLRGKWTGTGMPNLYCNPSSSSCSPSAGCGTLVANQSLSIGDTLNSCDGRFRLVMQGDGNLVIYENGHGPVWASGTVGQNGSHVIMQGDGDLVMYTSNGQAVWSSGTHNGPGAHLELKNDGGLVVIRDDVPLWSTGCGAMVAGQTLNIGENLDSCDGRFRLVMQGDGNLVLYETGQGPLWASHTVGQNGNRVALQGDGNLVMYTSSGQAVWSSGTHGHPGAYLALQDDGDLVIYDHLPVWNTGTHDL